MALVKYTADVTATVSGEIDIPDDILASKGKDEMWGDQTERFLKEHMSFDNFEFHDDTIEITDVVPRTE